MKNAKNIAVGFLVSFIGSIPLGYLNVIGYEIYLKSGIRELVPYLLGVVVIEAVVIFSTLLFADKLMHNKRLIKFIEIFSIIFMLLLAWSFYASASQTDTMATSNLSGYIRHSSFVIGIIFSSLNFIQIPFWTGWNLYLINGNYIILEKSRKYFYLAGTLIGTFLGMLALVLFLGLVTSNTGYLSQYLMKYIIPLLFLGMGLYQAFTFYKKYYPPGKS
jgi:threonine/homoserine/homoserine lactone efflux protein